ncbi:hypothetical protein P9G43_04850 [Bacillus spizizenii]|uniref:hypothetical protein n=1 Tax=Bacillus spizizenii TaxID=96241 RepID=UPI002DB618AE|nr:hypothetical protein [Bacillus spizizenii]MEC2181976.1 hypothetical protein [Bacillus spizizenii]
MPFRPIVKAPKVHIRPTGKAPKAPKKEPMNPNKFAGLMRCGVLTVNEVREYHGLSPIVGGDSKIFNGKMN